MNREVHRVVPRMHAIFGVLPQIMRQQDAAFAAFIKRDHDARDTNQRQNSKNYTHVLDLGMSPVFSKIGAPSC